LQVAQEGVVAATLAQSEAASRLAAVKARLPQPEPADTADQQGDLQALDGAADDASGAEAASLQQQQQQQQPELSPEQKRLLADAQSGLAAANATLTTAEAAAAVAGELAHNVCQEQVAMAVHSTKQLLHPLTVL
jgi:hypothetical protein